MNAFEVWMESNGIYIDRAIARKTFEKIVDTDRAIVLFDRAFIGYDPAKSFRQAILTMALTFGTVFLIVGGCLGGIWYLIRSWFF
jgi:hypothetical protein